MSSCNADIHFSQPTVIIEYCFLIFYFFPQEPNPELQPKKDLIFLTILFSSCFFPSGNTGKNARTPLLVFSVCMPLCNMAFYSYVMMKSVHVGTEAILHVVVEQHDGSMKQAGAPRCLLASAHGDQQHMVG